MVTGSDELKGVRKLYKFSRLLLDGSEPEALLDRLVGATHQITDADDVILFLIEGGEPRIHSVASDSPPTKEGNSAEAEIDYSETLIDEVITRGEPQLLKDVCDDPRFRKAQSIQMLSITSAMGAPLYDNGQLVGALYAARRRVTQNFTEKHRELMTVAASQASLLLSRLASSRALDESTSRYQALVEASPSAIVVVRDGQVSFANQTACRLWDCETVAQVVGRQIGELFDAWRSKSLLEALRHDREFDAVDAWVRERPEAPGRPVDVVGRPVQFGGEEAMQLVITEIGTGEELLERRLHTDRLRVMGTMAASVGHEINNPLSYVYANIDFVLEELSAMWEHGEESRPAPRVREDVMDGLRSARQGTERIRQVVESMRSFMQLGEEEGKQSPVARPLKSSLRIARRRLGDDVEVDVDIEATPPVALDAARLGQVFLNLLVNAADAMEEVAERSEKTLAVQARCDGEQVVVEIADSGPGIDPEIRDQIFEPFVSTKEGDSGTGLGLAICRELVEIAGGTIEVESTPEEGSLFRLRFPPVTDDEHQDCPTEDNDVDSNRQSTAGVEASILVVETEPAVCRSLRNVLQQHRVTAATTKGEAIELMARDNDFDVVLCDLSLRQGLGRDLFDWMKSSRPDCWRRLVAMAPQKPDPESRDYLEQLPNPWIGRPLDLDQLRGVITEMVREDAVPAPSS